ncbi:hypothetical protein [Helicobacter sp. 23-1045]
MNLKKICHCEKIRSIFVAIHNKINRATAPKLARFVVQKIGSKRAVVRVPIFC